MGLGDILAQVLQDGMDGRAPTRRRIDTAARNLGSSGGGMDAIFGQFQNALGGSGIRSSSGSGGLAGLAEKATDFLRQEQAGGLSGAQLGGIGAAAGALLGGGLGGAARGGALALLGTLALGALKSARAANGQVNDQDYDHQIDPSEVKTLVSPDNEKLLLRAMLSAAKADGRIDRDEISKITGKLGDISADEKQFITSEIKAPVDIGELVSNVHTKGQAAEVYAASLLAIQVDSDQERKYLVKLADALQLNQETVARLHEMTGAPV